VLRVEFSLGLHGTYVVFVSGLYALSLGLVSMHL